VVFAPHQDDETLGCGGTILRKRAAGAPVDVVFTTDGATSHQRLMPPAEMAALREREALAAAEVLGLAPDTVHFLRFRNRELTRHHAAAVTAILPLLGEREPAEIFVPSRHEAPVDHWATQSVVCEALTRWRRPVRVYEYPVWLWQHWPWSAADHYRPQAAWQRLRGRLAASLHLLREFRCGVEIDEVRQAKRAALARHRSQMTRLVDDPRWQTLGEVGGGEFLECFFARHEVFHCYDVPGRAPRRPLAAPAPGSRTDGTAGGSEGT
jgi:LmbE family N-acetylglucosaminyl deacetylase